jgi:hypothetical protein
MAQDLQKLKNEIWYAKQALEKQEASHAEWAAQVRGIPLWYLCLRSIKSHAAVPLLLTP